MRRISVCYSTESLSLKNSAARLRRQSPHCGLTATRHAVEMGGVTREILRPSISSPHTTGSRGDRSLSRRVGLPKRRARDAPNQHCPGPGQVGKRTGRQQRRKPPMLELRTLLGARNYPAFLCSFDPLSNRMNQPSQHLSDCILLGTTRHGRALTPAQAKPGNETSPLGWPSLLVLADGLKMSVGCWRAHPGARPSAHRLPHTAQAVEFHRPFGVFIFVLREALLTA